MFGGGGTQKLGGDAYAAETRRIRNAAESGEYFAPNLVLSFFGIDFALKFGGEK